MMTTAEKFAAAQVVYDSKLDTHIRSLLPHVSGHDRSYDFDDVKQELLMVLWKCVMTYDPDFGASFNTLLWRSVQNRSASMVREVTAIKRTAVGGVVSIDVEAIGLAVDQAVQEWSAEDFAVAKLANIERVNAACVGSTSETGGRKQRRRTA